MSHNARAANPKAKLTEQDVANIRASDESCSALARQYPVSRSQISRIRSGLYWPSLADIESKSTGYIHCAHKLCFAIIIGKPGDLCNDCKAEDEGHDGDECESCDNDSKDHE